MAELARVDGEEFPESEAWLGRRDGTGMRDLECGLSGLTAHGGARDDATAMCVLKELVGFGVFQETSLLDLRWLRPWPFAPLFTASRDGV
jgi:hypothetical protein